MKKKEIINRQQSEIEKLKKTIKGLNDTIKNQRDDIQEKNIVDYNRFIEINQVKQLLKEKSKKIEALKEILKIANSIPEDLVKKHDTTLKEKTQKIKELKDQIASFDVDKIFARHDRDLSDYQSSIRGLKDKIKALKLKIVMTISPSLINESMVIGEPKYYKFISDPIKDYFSSLTQSPKLAADSIGKAAKEIKEFQKPLKEVVIDIEDSYSLLMTIYKKGVANIEIKRIHRDIDNIALLNPDFLNSDGLYMKFPPTFYTVESKGDKKLYRFYVDHKHIVSVYDMEESDLPKIKEILKNNIHES